MLYLGNFDIKRDWDWAPEYVEARYLMLQQKVPEDFVIATGESYSLEDFVSMTFEFLKLDWRDHVLVDQQFCRPSESLISKGYAKKAETELMWKAKLKMPEIIEKMLEAA